MRADEWGDLVAVLANDQADERSKRTAKVQACKAIAQSLRDYSPEEFKAPDEWRNQDSSDLNGLRNVRLEDLRASAEAIPQLFALWRNHVWDYEARQAAKLQVLAWTMRELFALREAMPEAVTIIDRFASGIGDVLYHGWGLRDVPMSGDYRAWAKKSVQRFDLLPKAWRYV